MGRQFKIIIFVVVGIVITAPAVAAEYVPGLNCDQVGKLAEGAATDIKGDPSKGLAAMTLSEKILEMQYLFRNSPQTEAAIEKIVRGIYGNPIMRAATPEEVGKAYERTCVALAR